MARRRDRALVWCFVALVAVRVVAVVVTLDGAATGGRQTVLDGDVRRFHAIASKRGTPYADFKVEYPPLTLAAIEALNGSTVGQTTTRLMWSQLVLDLAIAAIVAWGWGRRAALLYLVLGLAFVWYPFLYLRLDLLSVALAVGGSALLRRRRVVSGAALVGLACFAKLWPIALAPGFVVRRSLRAVVTFVTVGVTGVVLWLGWVGRRGPIQVLTFRGARGWQIESTVGAVVHLLADSSAKIERGAARIGVVPAWARAAFPLQGITLVGVVWFLAGRVRRPPASVVDGVAPVAAITALLLCATILSPQYVSWLLPFAAIAAAGGEQAMGWLAGIAAFLSTLGLNLVKELNAGSVPAMAVVMARNAVLLVLFVTAVTRLVHVGRRRADLRVTIPARASVGVAARSMPVGEEQPARRSAS
jgi:hypothetical protein